MGGGGRADMGDVVAKGGKELSSAESFFVEKQNKKKKIYVKSFREDPSWMNKRYFERVSPLGKSRETCFSVFYRTKPRLCNRYSCSGLRLILFIT